MAVLKLTLPTLLQTGTDWVGLRRRRVSGGSAEILRSFMASRAKVTVSFEAMTEMRERR
jgi:hypothetical protein